MKLINKCYYFFLKLTLPIPQWVIGLNYTTLDHEGVTEGWGGGGGVGCSYTQIIILDNLDNH